MVENKTLRMFLQGAILLLLLFGLTRLIILSGGKLFLLELGGLVVLLVLSLAGFIGYGDAWGEKVVLGVFWLYLLNQVLFWWFTQQLSLLLLALALVGFLLSLPPTFIKRKKKSGKEAKVSAGKETEEPHSMVFGIGKAEKKADKSVPEKKAESSAEKKPEVKFIPGRYVASKNGNTYHEPKCEWARKIIPSRRLWLKSKEEAWEKGFKAHGCVQ